MVLGTSLPVGIYEETWDTYEAAAIKRGLTERMLTWFVCVILPNVIWAGEHRSKQGVPRIGLKVDARVASCDLSETVTTHSTGSRTHTNL